LCSFLWFQSFHEDNDESDSGGEDGQDEGEELPNPPSQSPLDAATAASLAQLTGFMNPVAFHLPKFKLSEVSKKYLFYLCFFSTFGAYFTFRREYTLTVPTTELTHTFKKIVLLSRPLIYRCRISVKISNSIIRHKTCSADCGAFIDSLKVSLAVQGGATQIVENREIIITVGVDRRVTFSCHRDTIDFFFTQ